MVIVTGSGLSFVRYEGDGTTQNFAVPFDYLKKEYVFVTINGTEVPFTWNTDAEVHLSVVPASGDIVFVKRNTREDARLVNFQDGGQLREKTLDQDSDQLFHLTQEALDWRKLTVAYDPDEGGVNAHGDRLINVGDGIEDMDAVNKRQLEEVRDLANSQVDRAKDEADRAEEARDDADGILQGKVDAAQLLANSASDSALAASGSASAADSDRIAAEAARDLAQGYAASINPATLGSTIEVDAVPEMQWNDTSSYGFPDGTPIRLIQDYNSLDLRATRLLRSGMQTVAPHLMFPNNTNTSLNMSNTLNETQSGNARHATAFAFSNGHIMIRGWNDAYGFENDYLIADIDTGIAVAPNNLHLFRVSTNLLVCVFSQGGTAYYSVVTSTDWTTTGTINTPYASILSFVSSPTLRCAYDSLDRSIIIAALDFGGQAAGKGLIQLLSVKHTTGTTFTTNTSFNFNVNSPTAPLWTHDSTGAFDITPRRDTYGYFYLTFAQPNNPTISSATSYSVSSAQIGVSSGSIFWNATVNHTPNTSTYKKVIRCVGQRSAIGMKSVAVATRTSGSTDYITFDHTAGTASAVNSSDPRLATTYGWAMVENTYAPEKFIVFNQYNVGGTKGMTVHSFVCSETFFGQVYESDLAEPTLSFYRYKPYYAIDFDSSMFVTGRQLVQFFSSPFSVKRTGFTINTITGELTAGVNNSGGSTDFSGVVTGRNVVTNKLIVAPKGTMIRSLYNIVPPQHELFIDRTTGRFDNTETATVKFHAGYQVDYSNIQLDDFAVSNDSLITTVKKLNDYHNSRVQTTDGLWMLQDPLQGVIPATDCLPTASEIFPCPASPTGYLYIMAGTAAIDINVNWSYDGINWQVGLDALGAEPYKFICQSKVSPNVLFLISANASTTATQRMFYSVNYGRTWLATTTTTTTATTIVGAEAMDGGGCLCLCSNGTVYTITDAGVATTTAAKLNSAVTWTGLCRVPADPFFMNTKHDSLVAVGSAGANRHWYWTPTDVNNNGLTISALLALTPTYNNVVDSIASIGVDSYRNGYICYTAGGIAVRNSFVASSAGAAGVVNIASGSGPFSVTSSPLTTITRIKRALDYSGVFILTSTAAFGRNCMYVDSGYDFNNLVTVSNTEPLVVNCFIPVRATIASVFPSAAYRKGARMIVPSNTAAQGSTVYIEPSQLRKSMASY